MRRRAARRRSSYKSRQRKVEKRFVDSVLHRLEEDSSAGRLTGPHELHDRVLGAADASLRLALARRPYRIRVLIRRVVNHAISGSVRMLADTWVHEGRRRLDHEEEQRTEFEDGMQSRWGPALDALRLFRLWCLDAGMALHERQTDRDEDTVYQVLVRLHARTCLIAAEVSALLAAGFPSGAHARWRTTHEIAVVAYFLSERGDDVAERYMLHEVVESYRATADYQRHAIRLGYEPLSEAELDSMRASVDALVNRFGNPYGRPYGWAAESLGLTTPRFRDLENAVSLGHLRPYYRMASHPTHAGPKGAMFDLGLGREDVMLAGPSNTGLADPGQCMAISLLQVTTLLLQTEADMGTVAVLQFLQAACGEVEKLFVSAQRQLDEDVVREAADAGRP
jgi:hypothetical protein